MFYRDVTVCRTANGHRYQCVFWWRGVWDVRIDGVTIRGLSRDEYMYFHRTF